MKYKVSIRYADRLSDIDEDDMSEAELKAVVNTHFYTVCRSMYVEDCLEYTSVELLEQVKVTRVE